MGKIIIFLTVIESFTSSSYQDNQISVGCCVRIRKDQEDGWNRGDEGTVLGNLDSYWEIRRETGIVGSHDLAIVHQRDLIKITCKNDIHQLHKMTNSKARYASKKRLLRYDREPPKIINWGPYSKVTDMYQLSRDARRVNRA